MTNINQCGWLLLALAVSCDQPNQLVEENPAGFCLSDNLRNGLVIDTLYERELTQHITLTGEVAYNPDNVIQFVSCIDGVIVQTHFFLGDLVEKNQVLATVKSPALNTMLAEKKSLEYERQLAEREYETAQVLYNDDIASERELTQARLALERLDAEIAHLRDNLAFFNPTPTQGVFEIRSPSTGYIVEKQMNAGMPVRDGDALFTVSALDEVWVMVNVYATDMQFVQEGMEVEIRT